MHIPIEPDAMNGLKLNFLLSKNPSTSEMVWCVKLRPITPLLATGSYGSIGDGIVRLSDFRQQQKLHIKNRKCRQDHEISGLLPFLSRGIDEGDAGSALARAVGVDARHL